MNNAPSTTLQNAHQAPKQAVQTLYTEQVVLGDLKRKKSQGKSLREIALDYPGATYGDIQRALQGDFPKTSKKRAAFNLPSLAPAPVCPRCGLVHVSKRCTANRAPRRPTWRAEAPTWWDRLGAWLAGEWECT